MKKNIIVLLFIIASTTLHAQFIKETSINAQIGYGLSAPYDSEDNVVNDGFFAQDEIVLEVASWVAFRPYVGVVLTNSDGEDLDGNPTHEKATTKAVLVGGKARVSAPIPWVAPYVEIGLGTSIGRFETVTAFDTFDKSGLIYHIPFSLGLALGKNNTVDVGFTYFFHPTVQQYAGALAVGFTFPL